MESLKTWLDEQVKKKKQEPNSRLGKAIAYMRTHWPALTLFLRVPGVPLDNNLSERVLKTWCYIERTPCFTAPRPGPRPATFTCR